MIQVNRDNLLAALTGIQYVCVKSNLPITSNVLVHSLEDKIRLTGCDLEVQLTTSCPAQVSNYTLPFTVSAKKLADMCKSFSADSEIRIVNDEAFVEIKSGKSKFKLSNLPAADFPMLAQSKITGSFLVGANDLKRMLAMVDGSVGKNDVRYYLNGTCLHLQGDKLVVVGTDGHRMAVTEYPMVESPTDQIILPRKYTQILLREIPKSDDPIRIEYSDNYCTTTWGETTISSKLIDGQYPDYNRVIPTSEHTALVNTKDVLAVLQRGAILKTDEATRVTLTFRPGKLEVSVSRSTEEFVDEIDIAYEGEEMFIGFNIDYLINAFRSLGCENTSVGFSNVINPIALRNPDNCGDLQVVMPMRL